VVGAEGERQAPSSRGRQIPEGAFESSRADTDYRYQYSSVDPVVRTLSAAGSLQEMEEDRRVDVLLFGERVGEKLKLLDPLITVF
jgi:hypothetical protein